MIRIIARVFLMETLLIIGVTGIGPLTAHAEEAASGHYLPGTTADFIDMLPDRDSLTFLYANAFTYYHGSAGGSRKVEFGGEVTANAKATIYADTSLFLMQTPWKLLGGQYGGAIVVPYFWMDIKGNLALNTRLTSFGPKVQDAANGFSDVLLIPLMFGWKYGDFKWESRFGIYAPTGNFETGRLANPGKNYWTFEPVLAASFLSSKIGLELTGFAGFDFNTENDATDYQSGDQFHLDLTAAQHLPLLGGFGGVGANGFYYQQFTGDSGSGARLGSFEGMTAGVGPVISYAYRLGMFDLATEVKWLPEIDVSNRLSGDIVWFKIGLSYAHQPANPIAGM
jgi:hypothetical protein